MRYGLISFLNARPLWWGLVHGAARSGDEFLFTSPAKCADLIADGSADLGLLPAIELLRIPDVVALPEICIASQTEVRSVLLFSRVPFDSIRSVALDPSSRTSVTLARILLGERLGEARYREIRFDPVHSARLRALEGHDAVVVIGDPALQMSKNGSTGLIRYDLASEWSRDYGEPFVFALWAGRRDHLAGVSREVMERLRESRETGLQSLEEIATEAAGELSLPRQELIEYFRSALHYELGERERSALARFSMLAGKWGLCDPSRTIEWLT